MDRLQELGLHTEALNSAVEADQKFFASILHYVRRLHQILTVASHELTQQELEVLAGKIEEFFHKWRRTGQNFYIPPRQTSDSDSTVMEINQLVASLASMPENEFAHMISTSSNGANATDRPGGTGEEPCMFIGHGRSKLWARVKVYVEDELGLPTITYESEPRTGESIVPVLERMLEQASFAVLVLTAEDDTAAGEKRARQNVVHEAGLFQGRLGFKRAVLLVQDGTEGFTNVDGLQHIPFTGEQIEQSFYELQRVLKREGQVA